MNLLEEIERRISSLGDGEYLPGLKAVSRHIGAGFQHLRRGQGEGDSTAFLDCVYRANQAFEGSVKEGYRVLAGKNPSKKTLFEIESFLESKSILSERVLQQFTRYRKEWRNPSTHDYTLEFDESEALLALVSVSAFCYVLLDQVAAELGYTRVVSNKSEWIETIEKRQGSLPLPEKALQGRLVDLLIDFAESPALTSLAVGTVMMRAPEAMFTGALAGFLESAEPGFKIEAEARLEHGNYRYRPDILVSDGKTSVVIEVKGLASQAAVDDGIQQVKKYLEVETIDAGILFLFPDRREVAVAEMEDPIVGKPLAVLAPQGLAPNPAVPAKQFRDTRSTAR